MFYSSFISVFISLILMIGPLEAAIISATPTTQTQVEFVPPTERFLMNNPLTKVQAYIKSWGINEKHNELFAQMVAAERIGFFGYNGGKSDFRIYMDIIRFGLEEILDLQIKPDFYFLRIPGHPNQNVNSAAQFLANHPHGINDNLALEAQQILSMNGALYASYENHWECSIWYYLSGWNPFPINYETLIIPFFIKLGIDPSLIHQAFEIGRSKLANKGEYLMQFFDESNYALVDSHIYLAISGGKQYHLNEAVSTLMLDPARRWFPQMRMVLSNKSTLNPYSSLSMKRYDMVSPETRADYEQSMRAYFQTLSVNIYQKELYKNELLTIWKPTY